MNPSHIERRNTLAPQAGQAETTEIVRQSLLLQSSIGAVVAVEYMKAYCVDIAVIGRVLSGGPVRAEDHAALAEKEHHAAFDDGAGAGMPARPVRHPDCGRAARI